MALSWLARDRSAVKPDKIPPCLVVDALRELPPIVALSMSVPCAAIACLFVLNRRSYQASRSVFRAELSMRNPCGSAFCCNGICLSDIWEDLYSRPRWHHKLTLEDTFILVRHSNLFI